jgi:glycosyltransferase involved in cell wall biosynthesis
MSVVRTVVATTTFNPVMDVRAQLAIQTVRALREHGYGVVVVDGGSPSELTTTLRELNAHVEAEETRGMGASRRQALTRAGEIAGPDGIVVWMEPEKLGFVDQIYAAVHPIIRGEADLVVPARRSLASYPPEQQHAEQIGDLAFEYLTGIKLDPWFGPRVMNQAALTHFLNYDGKYGDKWDSIFVPVLRAVAVGLRVVSVEVDYTHPAEQTKAETGDIDMLIKRIDQLENLVPMLYQEAKRLRLYPR